MTSEIITPEQLKKDRQRLGLSQEELAEKMGYEGGKQTISLKERGKRKINLRDYKMMQQLIKAFDNKRK